VVRDEVYLIGEMLHSICEKNPLVPVIKTTQPGASTDLTAMEIVVEEGQEE
jgi:hypothetical protein